MPKRIQRKRTKGWKMPENCVSVTRPGKFGNPFTEAWEFREWLTNPTIEARENMAVYYQLKSQRIAILDSLQKLRGKDLACFCSLDAPCHADVLLELANAN